MTPMTPMDSRDPRTYAILGAAVEVQGTLEPGFLEAVHLEVVAIEIDVLGSPFRRAVELPVIYRRRPLKTTRRADFIWFESVLVELKSIARRGAIEAAQVLNYLRATGYEVGLLVDFAEPRLTYKRFANSKRASSGNKK